MKSSTLGTITSVPEVSHISARGIWLLIADKEYFLPYEEFPRFKSASVEMIFDVRLLHASHLHWPLLDVDLSLDQLENLEKYPLVAREMPTAP